MLRINNYILFAVLIIILYSCAPSSKTTTDQKGSHGTIEAYFNKSVYADLALPGNKANGDVNLEDKLIELISSANSTIDIAAYEINLPRLIDILISVAAKDVQIRLVIDAKSESGSEDDNSFSRYDLMRLNLEKMNRGLDGILNTNDDITIIADSPIFAVEDSSDRAKFNLPPSPKDYKHVSLTVGRIPTEGFLLADAERKDSFRKIYFSAGLQMHNKFVIIDTSTVFTGSWNYTVTGLYGSDEDMAAGNLNGNQQHSVVITNKDVAEIYLDQFETMWGGNDRLPDPSNSKFHTHKPKGTVKTVYVDSIRVDILFSPSDNVMDYITSTVNNEADQSIFFTIFSFSHQPLADVMKYKWEGSIEDKKGSETGFGIRGVFDGGFWNQWWSASTDMTGRTTSKTSKNNPNTRWNNPAPVYSARETRKLHSKTMVIDLDMVIIGSANWSANAADKNDENTLVIYDKKIANQFYQEMFARYRSATN